VPAAIGGLTGLGIVMVFIVADLFAVEPWDGAITEIGAVGHDVPATTNGADIHFATTGVDFGIVPLNKEVGSSFSFANVGNETLRIEDVKVRVLDGC
jgi:hypothetical protein